LPPLLPAANHVLRYGLFTASGIAGGLAGEKVDWAEVRLMSSPLKAFSNERRILEYR
jgi:hypothetical protein